MKKRKLHLYTDISGNEISINLYEYGKSNNKGIYIQGGIHGGELTYFIFNKLHNWLKKHELKLKQNVLLAPIVNPPAWNQRIYYYTAGKFDLYKGKDWNRSYGTKNGTLSQKISNKILALASQYDLTIDLHTARMSAPYLIYSDKNLHTLVKRSGLLYNYFIDFSKDVNKNYEGTLNHALLLKKKKCLTYECGSHDAYELENIEEVFNSIIQHIKFESKNTVAIEEIVSRKIFNNVTTIYAQASGFINYLVKPRDIIKKGDSILELFLSDNLGKKITIKSEHDGVVLEVSKTNICWVGDELVRIVPADCFIQ